MEQEREIRRKDRWEPECGYQARCGVDRGF